MVRSAGGFLKIWIEDRLPYVHVSLSQGDRALSLERVLLDTGSAASVFSADEVQKLGIVPEPSDPLRRVVGVGGSEFVITKAVEKLILGEIAIQDFHIQVGAMDYGFAIQGILGMDFLLRASAVIDLGRLEISGSEP
jgi:predicted aspartyl protease